MKYNYQKTTKKKRSTKQHGAWSFLEGFFSQTMTSSNMFDNSLKFGFVGFSVVFAMMSIALITDESVTLFNSSSDAITMFGVIIIWGFIHIKVLMRTRGIFGVGGLIMTLLLFMPVNYAASAAVYVSSGMVIAVILNCVVMLRAGYRAKADKEKSI